MTRQAGEATARDDWERRIYLRLTDTDGADAALALPAPTGVRAEPAVGHVRLSWDEVPGAAGYLIERTDSPDARPRLVRHGGSDVAAVAGTVFADTGLADGVEYRYRIGAVAGAEHPAWAWSDPVAAGTLPGPAAALAVDVDAASVTGTLDRVWRMVGSERLTQLEFGDDGHGNDIGAEFAEALRLAHHDLGVTHVRAHAVLHDDNQVVRDDLGYDFRRVDSLYDRLLALGVRPVVELSFMPAALAADPGQTVFDYRGIISPPKNWDRWRDLIGALAGHLVDRYGIDEVAEGMFEALMADLVVPETAWGPRGFGLADVRTAQVQMRYAQRLGYPVWGISPSSTADDTGDYSGFGAEGLTLPAGHQLSQCTTCGAETTVTPHASVIALDVLPQQAYANIQALRSRFPGVYTSDGGFFDSVNPTTGAIGHRRLVLDQSMIMAALDNALDHGALQRRFAADPTAWAARTYLGAETMSIH